MKRYAVLFWVLAATPSFGQDAFISFEGVATESVLLEFETNTAPPNTPEFTDEQVALSVGMTGLQVRNALVPEEGITTFWKRMHVGGIPAIMRNKNKQRWYRTDGGAWLLLEMGVPTQIAGLTITQVVPGLTDASVPATTVPAVSTWGLAVMVLLLGIAATAMIRKRRCV